MQQSGVTRRRTLRRFREAVCLGAAVGLYLFVWGLAHSGYQGTRGHTTLAGLGLVETAALAALFALEAWRPRRRPSMPWITMAWLSLPLWCLVEVLAAVYLRAVG